MPETPITFAFGEDAVLWPTHDAGRAAHKSACGIEVPEYIACRSIWLNYFLPLSYYMIIVLYGWFMGDVIGDLPWKSSTKALWQHGVYIF